MGLVCLGNGAADIRHIAPSLGSTRVQMVIRVRTIKYTGFPVAQRALPPMGPGKPIQGLSRYLWSRFGRAGQSGRFGRCARIGEHPG